MIDNRVTQKIIKLKKQIKKIEYKIFSGVSTVKDRFDLNVAYCKLDKLL